MRQSAGEKRAAALSKLKRRPPIEMQHSGADLQRTAWTTKLQLTGVVLSTGPPPFSASTSHEQNDMYMQEFDKAYAELEALSIANRYAVFLQSAL